IARQSDRRVFGIRDINQHVREPLPDARSPRVGLARYDQIRGVCCEKTKKKDKEWNHYVTSIQKAPLTNSTHKLPGVRGIAGPRRSGGTDRSHEIGDQRPAARSEKPPAF